MVESSAVSKGIPKPILRGLHNATIKRNLLAAGILTAAVGIAYKTLHNNPRKADYANFYAKYDANAAFDRMVKSGALAQWSK